MPGHPALGDPAPRPPPQLLCTLTFWLLLRQFVKEKLLKRARAPTALTEVTVADTGEQAGQSGDSPLLPDPKATVPSPPACPTEPTRTQTLLRSLGKLVTGIYAKYWIYVCAGMFIVVSFAGRLVVYKIVYMFLFLLCLTLFQVPAGAAGAGPSRGLGLTAPSLDRSTTACGGSCSRCSGGWWWPTPCWCSSPSTPSSSRTSPCTGAT